MVAALIERDGHLLIGQRKIDDRHPLKWEFPGGKVERGETPRQALERELFEELEIRAKIGPELVRYEHRFANRSPILLIFHSVREFDGEPACAAFEQIRWEVREKLPGYDFLDGDTDFVRRLARHDL